MTPCPFTPYVALYTGPPEALREHFSRCLDCHTVALIVLGHTAHAGRDAECPDPATLAAYDDEVLDPQEHQDVGMHVRGCGYCQHLLVEEHRVEADPDETRRALLKGNAYVLAKEITEWLATEKYPREKERVASTFDSAFEDAFRAEPKEAAEQQMEFALGFAGDSQLPLFQKIIFVSLLASNIMTTGEGLGDLRGRLRDATASLLPGLVSADLLEEVATYLEGRATE